MILRLIAALLLTVTTSALPARAQGPVDGAQDPQILLGILEVAEGGVEVHGRVEGVRPEAQ